MKTSLTQAVTEAFSLKGIPDNRAVAQLLNDLLANYQIYYQNLRGLHWNIKGQKFFELHAKFEELYDDAIAKVDEVAERCLALNTEPLHSFSDYLAISQIQEVKSVKDGIAGVEVVISNLSTLLTKQRIVVDAAAQSKDEGTVDLISSYITSTEKVLWMMKAHNENFTR